MSIRKHTPIFGTAALAMATMAGVQAGSPPVNDSAVALAGQLTGKSWQADQGPLNTLRQRRQILAKALIAEARSPRFETRAAAMYLLGLNRMVRAVPVLSANVQFRYLFDISMLPVPGSSTLPAMHALIRIGSPSVPAMVKNLETTTSPVVAACSAWVIRNVDGPQLGACVVELALRGASAPLEKARLRAALASISSKRWRWAQWSPMKLPAGVEWPTAATGK